MNTLKDLFVSGVSVHATSAAQREDIAFSDCQAAHLLSQTARLFPGLEVVVLSTCNRVEFYFGASSADSVHSCMDWIRKLRPEHCDAVWDEHLYEARGAAAVRHLFHVASGLDSKVLGDVHIVHQIKRAIEQAQQAGTLGSLTRDVFTRALRVGKEARSNTEIGRGAASVGSALASMLERRFDLDAEPDHSFKVLVLGAGDMARDVGLHLAKIDSVALFFSNRNSERALKLAQRCRGHMVPWHQNERAIRIADLVICATAAPGFIVSSRLLDVLDRDPNCRLKLVVDIGLPRNVEPGSTLETIDIDDITEQRTNVLRARQAAIPAVKRVVERFVFKWEAARSALPLESIIRELYAQLTPHSLQCVQALVSVTELPKDEAAKVVERSFRRLLHPHVARLRGLAR